MEAEMLKINKKSPPKGLMRLYNTAKVNLLSPEKSYQKLKGALKEKVLKQLIEEQGYLCAYCMRKIPDNRAKPEDIPDVSIEHWFPRNPQNGEDRLQGLDYRNMFAVCSGNKGVKDTRKRNDLTCDAHRGNELLTVNPTIEETISKISYQENGIIFSEDEEINDDLDVKLNLNCTADTVSLPAARKAVLDSIQKELNTLNSKEEILERAELLLDLYENEKSPRTPYIGIGIWWLKDYIQRLKNN